MKLIYIVVLHILALSTGTHASERQLRAKAARRSNLPSTSPTSTPTASQSTRRRPKATKRTRRPIVSQSSTPTSSPSAYPSTSPSESPSNSPFVYYWNETVKLTASDGVAGDVFGYSVSVSGNVAIVGAYDDVKGLDSGSAYVFEKDELTGYWNQTALLTASDGAAGDVFGYSVSVYGNIALVGAYFDGDNGIGSGSVYVFERDESTGYWNETAKLIASDGAADDNFGCSVSVSEETAIIGARGTFFRSGSVYIFEKQNSTGNWDETAKLTASSVIGIGDFFGHSVSVSKNKAIAGSYLGDAAYVFEKDDSIGSWKVMAELTASDGEYGDLFGYSVSIFDNTAVVGAYLHDGMSSNSGSAYIFERDESTGHWKEMAKIEASDGAPDDLFGVSVSISGNVVIVGAYDDDDNGDKSGSAYLFEQNNSTGYWNETDKLTASDGVAYDNFGRSVSISGNTAIVSAHQDDDNGDKSGSVYVFERATMYL